MQGNTRLGSYSLVQGGCRFIKDIPPYIVAAHEPIAFYSINTKVLELAGFSETLIKHIAQAYRILYKANTSQHDALLRIQEQVPNSPEIEPLLESFHTKALILGTGGASKAINYGLKTLGIETLFVSRSAHNEHTITYSELTPEIMDEYKIIVNCTPVGMYPQADKCPEIPYEYLTPRHLLYDLLYNPNTTLFMRKGSEHGAVVKNGLEMLLLQAFGAWDIWNK